MRKKRSTRCTDSGAKKRTSSHTVRDLILDRIQRGEYGHEQMLPGQMALATDIGVNYRTVNVAIRSLEQEGWLRASGRNWLVDSTSASRMQILSDNIVSFYMSQSHAKDLSPGFDVYIQFGVMEMASSHARQFSILDPSQLTRDDFDKLVNSQPMGCILYPDLFYERVREIIKDLATRLKHRGVPVVLYGYESELGAFDSVTPDFESGTASLARLLISRNRRRILRYWERRTDMTSCPWWLKRRNDGYEKVMNEAGLEGIEPFYCYDLPMALWEDEYVDLRLNNTVGNMVKAFSRWPDIDAIMAISDRQTAYLAAACRKLGRESGSDIDIVGYDNYWQIMTEWSWEPCRPLATVDKRNREMGWKLVDVLEDRIAGRLPDEPMRILYEPHLIRLDE